MSAYCSFQKAWSRIGQAGFDSPITPFAVSLSPANIISSGKAGFSMTLVPASGLFSGTFIGPGTGNKIPYHGAVFQAQDLGAGWFIGKGKSGAITLGPYP